MLTQYTTTFSFTRLRSAVRGRGGGGVLCVWVSKSPKGERERVVPSANYPRLEYAKANGYRGYF
jgi:hypothetical protein